MRRLTRREFLKAAGAAGAVMTGVPGAAVRLPRAYSQLLPQAILGKTGVQVSRLGLGGKGVLQYGASESAAIGLIHQAIDSGITYIDTSDDYGASEQRIGEVVRTRRGEVFLATKTGARDYDGIMAQVDRSLARLRTDHIDLLQAHYVNDSDDIPRFGLANGAYWTLCKLRDQGVCRFIGITGHPLTKKPLQAVEMYDWDCFLGIFNPLCWPEAEFFEQIPMARSRNMGIIGMKAFGGGYPNASWVGDGIRKATHSDLLRYALSERWNHSVDVVIAGVADSAQLDQLLDVVRNFQPMSAYECWLLEQRLGQSYVWISDLKRRPDGCSIEIDDANGAGVIVTAVFDDCCYVESADRLSAIKVTGATVSRGQRIRIHGTLGTDTNGERCLAADAVTPISSGSSVEPFYLSAAAVGGADLCYCAATGSGQRGVTGGSGANNIGLLVSVSGAVKTRGGSWLRIDDGSRGPGPSSGVRIDFGDLPLPTVDRITATGISTLLKSSGDYLPRVRIRSMEDIR